MAFARRQSRFLLLMIATGISGVLASLNEMNPLIQIASTTNHIYDSSQHRILFDKGKVEATESSSTGFNSNPRVSRPAVHQQSTNEIAFHQPSTENKEVHHGDHHKDHSLVPNLPHEYYKDDKDQHASQYHEYYKGDKGQHISQHKDIEKQVILAPLQNFRPPSPSEDSSPKKPSTNLKKADIFQEFINIMTSKDNPIRSSRRHSRRHSVPDDSHPRADLPVNKTQPTAPTTPCPSSTAPTPCPSSTAPTPCPSSTASTPCPSSSAPASSVRLRSNIPPFPSSEADAYEGRAGARADGARAAGVAGADGARAAGVAGVAGADGARAAGVAGADGARAAGVAGAENTPEIKKIQNLTLVQISNITAGKQEGDQRGGITAPYAAIAALLGAAPKIVDKEDPITLQKAAPITAQKTAPITLQKAAPITAQKTAPITAQRKAPIGGGNPNGDEPQRKAPIGGGNPNGDEPQRKAPIGGGNPNGDEPQRNAPIGGGNPKTAGRPNNDEPEGEVTLEPVGTTEPYDTIENNKPKDFIENAKPRDITENTEPNDKVEDPKPKIKIDFSATTIMPKSGVKPVKDERPKVDLKARKKKRKQEERRKREERRHSSDRNEVVFWKPINYLYYKRHPLNSTITQPRMRPRVVTLPQVLINPYKIQSSSSQILNRQPLFGSIPQINNIPLSYGRKIVYQKPVINQIP